MSHHFYKQEITPIANDDCFAVFERTKTEFDYPVHYHGEFELTCICHGEELTRYVGSHVEGASEWELLLIGPNLAHGWLHDLPLKETVYEKTLQFHADLFNEDLLRRNALFDLKTLFEQSHGGVLFSREIAQDVFGMLHKLAHSEGLHSFILLQQIFIALLDDERRIVLNDSSQNPSISDQNKQLYALVKQHYSKQIKLDEMAEQFSMSVSSFNRMIKKQTGNTFVTFLNEYRLGMATRKLIETEYSVEYIAKSCGFHNLSNFNKFFRRVYKTTPQRYRIEYNGTAVVR